MATERQDDGVRVRLLTTAGQLLDAGDSVTVTFGAGKFAVNGGEVHNVEESGTVVTIFATTPLDLPQERDVITYQISPADWGRCKALGGNDSDDPQTWRTDSDS